LFKTAFVHYTIIKKKNHGKNERNFMEEQERLIREAVEAFVDDDWQYQEYLKTQGKSISQKESQANHDAWWSSLTDEQKQQLYLDQEESINESNDEYLNHWLKKDNESR
jgi:hypothetical protein